MKEADVQKQIVKYLSLIKKDLIVVSDPNGLRVTMGQAVQLKSMRLPSNGGHPDILVLEPKGEYHGLFIEVKKEDAKLFTKKGKPYSDHISKQYKIHKMLREKGYFGNFACGFDDAKNIIDEYFS